MFDDGGSPGANTNNWVVQPDGTVTASYTGDATSGQVNVKAIVNAYGPGPYAEADCVVALG